MPLWTAGATDGALIDEAHAESLSNTLPMRGAPITVGSDVFQKNIATLRDIDAFFHEPGKEECDTVPHQAIVSFASLVGNPNALADFAAVLKQNPNARGEIYGLDTPITGLAANGLGGSSVGIVLEMGCRASERHNLPGMWLL